MKPTKQEGSDSIKNLVSGVIDGHRGDLKECRIAIIEASRMPGSVQIKTVAAGDVAQALGFDLTMIYSGPVFQTIDEKKSEMLVANSLADWKGHKKEGRDGQPDYMVYKKNNAIKVHPEILARYGSSIPEHAEIVEAVSQLELDLGAEEDKSVKIRKSTRAKVVAV